MQGGRKLRILGGSTAGLVALLVFLGVAELVAIATGPAAAPSVAIGQQAISHAPNSLKELAIRWFGEQDKTALLAGIYFVLAVIAAAVGALGAALNRAVGALGAGVLGVVGAVSAATAPTATGSDAIPSLIGAVAAAGAYLALVPARVPAGAARGAGPVPDPAPASGGAPTGSTVLATAAAVSRRRLLATGGAMVAVGAVAYGFGRSAVQSAYSAATSRSAVRLPTPASPALTASGTDFPVPGLAPYYTPTAQFYRVDTALVVPQLTTESYALRLHGMVDRPATFSYAELLAMPLVERTMTMVCVSDPVGGPYVGNARWLGVLLKGLLEQAGIQPGADQLFMTASDGMTIGAQLSTAMDGRPAMLALGMNGEPLPFDHGFPVRAVIPGFYGYVSACKWLVDLEVTTFAAKQAYWVQRGYAATAPVKLESRIDTPASFASLRAGTVTVAGSAWQPTVGISRVQVKVDSGPWHDATLAQVDSVDTWRLWRWDWAATPGNHTLQVRAFDSSGRVQTAAEAAIVPNGTTGRQSVAVTVS